MQVDWPAHETTQCEPQLPEQELVPLQSQVQRAAQSSAQAWPELQLQVSCASHTQLP
jgi:hypothetical protein